MACEENKARLSIDTKSASGLAKLSDPDHVEDKRAAIEETTLGVVRRREVDVSMIVSI